MNDDAGLARARDALDRLEAVEREATPGPWDIELDEGNISRAFAADDPEVLLADHQDVSAIVAFRNLARPLLGLARATLAVEADGHDDANLDALARAVDALVDALDAGGEA